MEVHCLSDEQVATAHLGCGRGVLGVGTRGDGLLAKVRNDQKRVCVVERG